MADEKKLAEFIIEQVGGKENIIRLQHCTTRLRFTLKDEAKADENALKEHDGIAGVAHANDQFQVVIGLDVPRVYEAIMAELDSAQEKAEDRPENEKKGFGKVLTDFLGSVMGKIIPFMIASGILTGISFLLLILGVMTQDSTAFKVLYCMGNAIFYFFPFVLGYCTADYLGMPPLMGLVLAGFMCHPSINGTDLSVFGHTINVTYTSTFLPIIFTCLLASPLYKWFNKVFPTMVRSFLSIALTLVIAGAAGFFLIGPVMNLLSDGIYHGVMALYELSPVICGGILGGIYELLVMFGLHGVLGLISMDNIVAGRPDVIAGLSGFAIFGVMMTVLAMVVKTKHHPADKGNYLGCFVSSLFGVTEPTIYGPMLTHVRMWIPVIISGAIGGIMAGFFGIKLQTYSGMGVLVLLGFIDPHNSRSLIEILLTAAAVCASAFVIAMAVYHEEKESAE